MLKTTEVRSKERSGLWKGKPDKSLLVKLKNTGGRNFQGRITCRGRNAMGKKRFYRIIDYFRRNDGSQAIVRRKEYDPNRNAFILYAEYPQDGKYSYIIAPEEVSVGDSIVSGIEVPIAPGNSCELRNIPSGTLIHNIEETAGQGAKFARSAGVFAKLLGKEADYAIIQLPSKEVRKVPMNCRATIGAVSHKSFINTKFRNAGTARWATARSSKVRGCAMNPVDHPMGGDQGKGGKIPHSRTGKMKKGQRTRKTYKKSSALIISRRK